MIATAIPCLARPVTTDADVESLRVIRNACRTYMTIDQSYIDEDKQRLWWAYHNAEDWTIWLVSVSGIDAGYCLLRRDRDLNCWYTSVGILPEWRGKGIGKAIHVFLAAQKPGERIVARTLQTNIAAQGAIIGGGFQFSHDEGDERVYVAAGGTIGLIEPGNHRGTSARPDVRRSPAGRAMDAFIAEDVMGWSDLSDHEGLVVAENGHLLGRPPGQVYLADVPEFSRNNAAALQVLPHVAAHNFVGFTLTDSPADGVDERWCAAFGRRNSPSDRYVEAVAPTPALAICRAALLAVRHG